MAFPKLVVFVNSLVPLVLLLWDLYHKRVGPNPLEFATRTTGMLTLIFLSLTVAVTPLRKIFGVNSLVKLRRMLGLFAFFYGSLHLLTYVWFDRLFNLLSVGQDVVRRPFILAGMTAFVLMVPLAITSTNKMVKRLGGKRWARLHQLVYLAADSERYVGQWLERKAIGTGNNAVSQQTRFVEERFQQCRARSCNRCVSRRI